MGTHRSPEGSAPGLGRRASYLEDYQPGLGATIAAAICAPDPAQLWDYGLAVSKQKEATGCLFKLQTTLKSEVVRSVQRLHRNLGHPKPEALVEPAEEPVIKSSRQLATSNALHACTTSDQTKWHLLPCDIKLMKLVNACRPMCCGLNATSVQRNSPFSVLSTRPPSTLWRHYFKKNMVTVSSMVLKEPGFGILNFPNAFVLMKDVVGWVNAWTTQHCGAHRSPN